MHPGKSALRAELRRARRARPVERRRADAEALAAVVLAAPVVAGARTLALYASTPTEPGTGPLRAALAARGVRVLLPVVDPEGADRPLRWAWDGPAGGEGDDTAAALARADVVLLPALAVDADGHRLGQGGGHYDRTLEALAAGGGLPPLVAVVHDEEVLPAGALPVEGHDVRVDAAATPARWVALPRRRG